MRNNSELCSLPSQGNLIYWIVFQSDNICENALAFAAVICGVWVSIKKGRNILLLCVKKIIVELYCAGLLQLVHHLIMGSWEGMMG